MEAIRLVPRDSPKPARPRAIRVVTPFDFRRLLQPLAYGLAIAIAAAGALLLSQRLQGELSAPLGAAALVITGFLSTCWAALTHLMIQYARPSPPRSWREKTIVWLPTVGLAMIGAGISLPGSPLAAMVAVWALIGLEEYAASFNEHRVRGVQSKRRAVPNPFASRRALAVRWPRVERFTDARWVDAEESSLTDSVQQQFVRERTQNGEVIRGTLRAAIAAGQQVAIAHLVFCPALDEVPAIEAELTGDIDGSVRATHAFRYGARLEIKLSEPSDAPAEVFVGYHVQKPASGA